MKPVASPLRILCVFVIVFFYLAAADIARSQNTVPNFSVTIAQPTNGQAFVGPTDIQLIASAMESNGAVSYVQFFDGSTSLGIVSNFVIVDPPGSPGLTPGGHAYLLTWPNAPVGTHSLSATAADTNGVTATSSNLTIYVNPQNGSSNFSVTITQPTNGSVFTLPTNVDIDARTYDTSNDVAYVQFVANPANGSAQPSRLLGTVSNGLAVGPNAELFSLTWTQPPTGLWSLTATAYRSNGSAVGATLVTIQISSAPPVVRITSPANNSVFRAPVNVALTAYAHAAFGDISRVEFFIGSTGLGFGRRLPAPMSPIPNPPYYQSNTFELTWSNAPTGTNVVTAVATANSGLVNTSAPVNIIVVVSPVPSPTNRPDVVSIVATDPVAIASTNCWSWLGLGAGSAPTWSNWTSPTALWRWFTNCGPNDAIFTVRRAGPATNDLIVNYTIGGTASNGLDYSALPGVVTIPVGQAAAMITVVPLISLSNVTKTVLLTLSPSTNSPADYVLGFPPRAEALIVNRPTLRPNLAGAVLGDRSFHLTDGGPDGAWFRVDYRTDAVNWIPVCTNQVVNGSIDFADPDAGDSTRRLYRTVPVSSMPGN